MTTDLGRPRSTMDAKPLDHEFVDQIVADANDLLQCVRSPVRFVESNRTNSGYPTVDMVDTEDNNMAIANVDATTVSTMIRQDVLAQTVARVRADARRLGVAVGCSEVKSKMKSALGFGL